MGSARPRYRTRNERVFAVWALFESAHGYPVLLAHPRRLTEWARSHELLPIPSRSAAYSECIEWEGKLDRARCEVEQSDQPSTSIEQAVRP